MMHIEQIRTVIYVFFDISQHFWAKHNSISNVKIFLIFHLGLDLHDFVLISHKMTIWSPCSVHINELNDIFFILNKKHASLVINRRLIIIYSLEMCIYLDHEAIL